MSLNRLTFTDCVSVFLLNQTFRTPRPFKPFFHVHTEFTGLPRDERQAAALAAT